MRSNCLEATAADIVLNVDAPPSPSRRRRAGEPEDYPCPRCGQIRVHRSRIRSLCDEAVLALFLVAPYRCHGCYRRFRAFAPAMRLIRG